MSARAYIEPGKIPPAVKELLETLRKSGCCLSVLEDMLMDDDVIYDK